jgi:putative phosphoesterase
MVREPHPTTDEREPFFAILAPFRSYSSSLAVSPIFACGEVNAVLFAKQPMLAFPEARTVAILGDTHGLLRPELTKHLSGIDLILHSGDVGQITVLHRLKQYAPVVAVRGNVDDHLDGLPETELITIGGRLVYVLHVLANLDLDPAVAGFAMVVSGHSHQPLIRTTKGVLYVNPGSVGPRRFKLPICFVRAEFNDAGIKTRLIELVV